MNQLELDGLAATNFQAVTDKIVAAGGDDIILVCVTKYASDDCVRALLKAGATDLAENLLPRAADRFSQLFAEGLRFRRHLIGAQQSRKVKLIPGSFDMVQAVDRLKIADMLNERLQERGETMDILLEVNIAEEEQKHGLKPPEVAAAAEYVLDHCPALALRGLMAVPPWPDAYEDENSFERETREYFRQMRRLFDRIRSEYPSAPGLDILSLGMSQDYVWAVEEGATMVRVGSALFAGL